MPTSVAQQATGGRVSIDRPPSSAKLEIGGVLGLLVAGVGVLSACHAEGESLRILFQPTALLVVVAGTCAAILIQYPLPLLREALRRAAGAFYRRRPSSEDLAADLTTFARMADKGGLLSLDAKLASVRDPFLRKALTLAVDGLGEAEIRSAMELDLQAAEHTAQLVDRVFETAGGTTPPLGILGAVLGLIRVMHTLGGLADVGPGIAAAFVSTLYGVALANLFLLPLGGKLRIEAMEARRTQEMMLEGVLGIAMRVRPRLLESRLGSYVPARHLARSRAG